ncbi:hypothetical protein L3V79_02860 [Thiotrichales bacterium 19S9-12]|nr:hypothetical protein [Thiotrichales bacterium 19S9-11]MCF6811299.1 hypothetical protein [Thiotrichales bacterium 19S9-12]
MSEQEDKEWDQILLDKVKEENKDNEDVLSLLDYLLKVEKSSPNTISNRLLEAIRYHGWIQEKKDSDINNGDNLPIEPICDERAISFPETLLMNLSHTFESFINDVTEPTGKR